METPWPDNARLAVTILVELPDSVRNDAETFYGLDAGLPRLLRLLNEYGLKAGFLVRGDLCETRPELLRELVQAGHELLAHGNAEELVSMLESLQLAAGIQVTGACEAGAAEEAEASALLAGGYRYRLLGNHSELPWVELSEVGPLVCVPLAPDLSDQWLLGTPATDAWLQYLIDSFDTLFEEGAEQPRLLSLLLHPEIIGRPGRIKALEQFLQYLSQQEQVWTAPPGAIALIGG